MSRTASGLRAGLLAATVLFAVLATAPRAADAPASSAPGYDATLFDHPATQPELTDLLGPVARKLNAAAALSGAFTQRKQLRELPKPLQSSGDFFVARGIGVDWHTRKPFDSELVLMPQALIQKSADGQSTRTDASQQPGLQAVSQVFDALFALDLDKLSKTFTLYGRKAAHAGEDWTLGLVPVEPALAHILQRIVVTGADQPQRILLLEVSGDQTEIVFTGVTALSTLAEADRKRFAP